MKRLWIILLAIVLLIISGCTLKQNNDNNVSTRSKQEIPSLTEEEASKVIKEASRKYRIITRLGEGIPNCEFENEGLIEIKERRYSYFGSSLDTIEEFNEYLGKVFTEKSIQAIMNTQNIIVYEGKLLRLNADAGGGVTWSNTKISSIRQTDETAEVEFEIPLEIEDTTEYFYINFTFKYTHNLGWLIDTEKPGLLY